ncbi:MAG: DUF885 domain-containing protein [Christensenellaceae bacterium]|jgi:uncharacterized protein (DUF885 family)|nr:DUF885 domain-containing protein [Christensenellaceae bacterium]
MNKKKKTLAFVLAVVLVASLASVGLSACFDFGEPDIPFDDFTKMLFEIFLDGDGLAINLYLDDPSVYELDTFDIYLPGISSFNEHKNDVDGLNEALDEIKTLLDDYNYEKLNADQKITYKVLAYAINEMRVDNANYYYFKDYLGRSGTAADVPSTLQLYRFKDVNDIRRYLEYIEIAPEAFSQYVDFEFNKCEAGYGFSDSYYEQAIDAYENIISETTDVSEHSLIEIFDTKIDAIASMSTSSKNNYKERNLTAVSDLLEAYEDLIKDIEDLLIDYPTSSRNQKGLYYANSGADYYRTIFEGKTGSSDSFNSATEKLVSYGKSLMNAISNQPEDYDAIIAELFASEDNEFTSENALAVLGKINDSMAQHFPSLSVTPEININLLTQSQQKDYISGYYVSSPIDNVAAKQNIYLNPTAQNVLLYNLMSHEGYPGHLYQSLYLRTQDVSDLRYILTNLGWTEGWAVYCESIAAEYISTDSSVKQAYKAYLASEQYTNVIVSLCDILVNGLGYTKEQLTSYSNEKFGYATFGFSADTLSRIIDIVIELPGTYLPYAYGELMINEIKKEYMRVSSTRTDYQFHEELLRIGSVDFQTLRELLGL